MEAPAVISIGDLLIIPQATAQNEHTDVLGSDVSANEPVPSEKKVQPSPLASPTKMGKVTPLSREPFTLGVVQIMIGVMCILYSLTSVLSPFLISSSVYCSSTWFVLSGVLTIQSGKRTTDKTVWFCLVSNIGSVLLGLAGIVFTCWLMAAGDPRVQFCDDIRWRNAGQLLETDCTDYLWALNGVVYGLRGIFLVLLLLEVCVAITACVFSGKTIIHLRRYMPIKGPGDDECPVA